jgi:hypothetical protein
VDENADIPSSRWKKAGGRILAAKLSTPEVFRAHCLHNIFHDGREDKVSARNRTVPESCTEVLGKGG